MYMFLIQKRERNTFVCVCVDEEKQWRFFHIMYCFGGGKKTKWSIRLNTPCPLTLTPFIHSFRHSFHICMRTACIHNKYGMVNHIHFLSLLFMEKLFALKKEYTEIDKEGFIVVRKDVRTYVRI